MTSHFNLYVPVELVSEANQREHWAVKSKRKKRQRELVRLYWKLAGSPMVEAPIRMKLVRLHTSRRKIRDFDNLVSSFKAVIDEVSELLGVNDSTIRWPELRTEAFSQRQAVQMGCRIEVEQWTG